MFIPAQSKPPSLNQFVARWRGHAFALPVLYREGSGGPAILFVHGLGGAKEHFDWALRSPALADCTLVSFDAPGTGQARFVPDAGLDVSALADMTHQIAACLLPYPYWVAGASMGGLIALLLIRRFGLGRIQGIINLEGNLAPEDCTFSRRVVARTFESFTPVYEKIIAELSASDYPGDRIMAQNMKLNVDIRAYHAYSFELVKESDSGRLMKEFLALSVPRLFLYGEHNRSLSYLSRLRDGGVEVVEIPAAAHFLFHDNPVATFEALGQFVHAPPCR